MISINAVGKRVIATLVVATVTAIVVSPAVAASKDDCAAAQTAIMARLAPAAHVRVLAHEAQLLRTIVSVHRAKLTALERTFVILDRDFETLELKRWHVTRHMDEGAEGRHPLTVGIDVLATFARLPGQAAIAARQTLVTLAKVTPRVLRAIL